MIATGRSLAAVFGSFENDKMLPGIYQLELRAGAASEQMLVRLAPGESYQRGDLVVTMSSAAPLPSTNNYHENHYYAAQALSKHAEISYAPDKCRVLLFARDVSPSRALIGVDRPFRCRLFDSEYNEIPFVDEAMKWDPSAGCAGVSISVKPGGYILSVKNRDDRDAVDQPIWASHGWQTMVFLPVSAPAEGVRLETHVRPRVRMYAASIHMAGVAEGWQPGNDVTSINLALAVEMCLPGLQAGRSLVPREQLMQMLNAKFQNPMFGIVGAYCMTRGFENFFSSKTLLQDRATSTDSALLHTVLEHLKEMLGGDHPDLAGVKCSAPRELYGSPLPRNVTWPPMIALGYQKLAGAAAENEESVAPESLAELAASWFDPGGPWTHWPSRRTVTWGRLRRAQAAAPSQKGTARPRIRADVEVDFLTNPEGSGGGGPPAEPPSRSDDLGFAVTSSDLTGPDEIESSAAPQSGDIDDLVENRVRAYLRELKEQDEESDPRALEAHVASLSSAMDLPIRLMRLALKRIITTPGDVVKGGS